MGLQVIRVSCREDRVDSTDFAKELIISGPPLKPNGKYIIFVHGYNNNYNQAKDFYETLRKNYEAWAEDGIIDGIIEFYWPSSWSALFGFLPAKRRAKRAAEFLAEYLCRSYLSSGAKFRLVSHSLGARVVLQESLWREPKDRKINPLPAIEDIYLMAPAIPADFFKDKDHIVRPVTVMYSKNDKTVGRVYRALHWFTPAMGYVGSELVDDVYNVDLSKDIFGHSDYQNSQEVIRLISEPFYE